MQTRFWILNMQKIGAVILKGRVLERKALDSLTGFGGERRQD